MREQGKTDDAVNSHDGAVARVRAPMGPNAGLGAGFWDQETRRERARTWAGIAERRAAAVDDLAEVIQGAEKLVEEYPHDPLYRDALAASYLRRGELRLLLGQVEPAEADLDKSLALSRKVIDSYGAQSQYVGRGGKRTSPSAGVGRPGQCGHGRRAIQKCDLSTEERSGKGPG